MKKDIKLFLVIATFSGISMMGCGSDDYKKADESSTTSTVTPTVDKPIVTSAGDSIARASIKTKKGKISSTMKTIIDDADAVPQYPGGQAALDKFISENIEYPSAALDAGIEGTVTVDLAFDDKGKIYTQKLQSTALGYGLDEEVMNAIKKMPMWAPGTIKGKKVKSTYSLPVKFQLGK